jgi:hypothetical protein
VEPLKTLIALALASTVTTAYGAEPKVAVFDLELVDTSIESATNGPRSDKGARLARLDREMRQRLTQSGRADVVDVAHVADQTHASDLRMCGDCDAGFANEFGARYSDTGSVQKVSNLILNMNIVMRDVGTGEVMLSKSVDMRGPPTNRGRARLIGSDRYFLAPSSGVL